MYFNKIHQPENFAFPNRGGVKTKSIRIGSDKLRYKLDNRGQGVYRLRVKHRRWPEQLSEAELNTRFKGDAIGKAKLSDKAGLMLRDDHGQVLLGSQPGKVFGVSDTAWMMCFDYDDAMRFYGMGEKYTGMEHSNKHTKFWNTDVWADFAGDEFVNGTPDPTYLSIPYLIVKRGNRYCGILINNPYPVFVSTNPRVRIAEQADAADGNEATRLFIGAPDGQPEVFFIIGPTLAELTRKLQKLVGTTPRPPLWSLGHQQCRWGYASYRDLNALDRKFREHKIPNDGLWLDIDYMTGYRVFTWNKKHWPEPSKQIERIQKRGQRVVPIFDPGVKLDPKYHAYKSGKKQDVFCKNPAGGDYVGFVWPGTTVFPDFSMDKGRSWWADHVEKTVKPTGITGCWLDMNDPATGLSINSEMRFRDGSLDHAAYHNQYANGMVKATFEGMKAAHPNERPFLLTRSGFTSVNRYAAAWTGDNFSNTHHLKNSIPTTLNLALSGLPFNGPDVPGFGGDATAKLAIAWYKAGFLFPFFRNHSNKGGRVQEPWSFGTPTMRLLRRYIRLRYRLLPYLYNLFVEQEESGEAILRPLLYDFSDTKNLALDRVDDQFMVGPAIMQAPVVDEQASSRRVLLPEARWYNAMTGRWMKGGRRETVNTAAGATPMYLRDGSILPMRPGEPTDNHTDLREIELHLFLSSSFNSKATYRYTADDGRGYGYRDGQQTRVTFEASCKGAAMTLRVKDARYGYGPLRLRVVTHGKFNRLTVQHSEENDELKLTPGSMTLTGEKLSVMRSGLITLGAE